jgi:hypothetical protein
VGTLPFYRGELRAKGSRPVANVKDLIERIRTIRTHTLKEKNKIKRTGSWLRPAGLRERLLLPIEKEQANGGLLYLRKQK